MNKQNETNQSIVIEDLTAENAAEVKGGPSTQSKRTVVLKSSINEAHSENDDNTMQGFSLNHNETVSEDTEAATDNIDDLPVSDEQSAEIAGGCNPLFSACGPVGNHNETVSEDNEAATDNIDDLPVSDEQSSEIAGGCNPLMSTCTTNNNHNETVSEDNETEVTTETIDDLPVSDEQSSEIAGGLLPAVQKVREAAARMECQN